MGFIYKITSPTGRLYVGQTKHLTRRINTYKYHLKKNSVWKNAKIMNSLQKYGWDAHQFEVIEEVPNDLLCEREIFWIKELGTYYVKNPKNMNMSPGGERGSKPWIFDKKRREKQAQRFSGEGNPFYGKKHTEEFKKRKSKEVSEYNKKAGLRVPEWGAMKGQQTRRRSVLMYDLKGVFVQEFASVTEASQNMGAKHSCISEVCSQKRTQTVNHIFRYKGTDAYPLKIEVEDIKFKTTKRPIVTMTPEYEVICVHASAQEASEFWGIPKTTINRAAQYNFCKPIRTGHVFIYQDMYDLIFAEVA